MAIWQDLVADSGFPASYQTVKRFVRKLRANQPLQVHHGPRYVDGKISAHRLFVMTLAYSLKAIRLEAGSGGGLGQ